jgi:pseudomonalisin
MLNRERNLLSLAAALWFAAASLGANPAFHAIRSHLQLATFRANAPGSVQAVAPAPAQTVALAGNVHPLARLQSEIGEVDSQTRFGRMMLLLKPSAAQQADLEALVQAQHDPRSPLFHQWLTPEEYGTRFGIGDENLEHVEAWLLSQGFTIDELPAGRRLILFSGTAGQVDAAFHAGMRRYKVQGLAHLANSRDPQVPAALADSVAGVVSLHDFRRGSAIRSLRKAKSAPLYSAGATHYLFPADFATIYDLNPLYGQQVAGSGIAIAIAGRSNIKLSDVATFRSISGLSANSPTVVLPASNPGFVAGDQVESTLDVEWSGAVAPSAAITFVAEPSTATTDGIDLASAWIVNHKPASIMSVSYGNCEQQMGAAEIAFYSSLWAQAASEGISVFVASGDAGAAGCSSGSDSSGSVSGVNGLCSSPYSTCVGGTEFSEGSDPSQYWSSTNSSSYGSAIGYIPEGVWNESALSGGSGMWASGGGVSRVYQQPGFQQGMEGISAAGAMRAVPDVSLSAADHDGYFVVENGGYWMVSGTSAASPAFAGVMALVLGSRAGEGQGNANEGLYPLAADAQSPFHPTPSGNNSVPGVRGFTASGTTYNLATGLGSVDGAQLVLAWGLASKQPSFKLAASANSGTVAAGRSTTFTVSVAVSNSATNAVFLSASASPGITIGFSSTAVFPGTPSTVTVTVASTAALGPRTIVLTGSNDSGSETLEFALTVTAPPTLKLTASSSRLRVVAGGTAQVRLTAATGGSFSGSILLVARRLPAGVTAAWSVNPTARVSGASVNPVSLTLAATDPTAPGYYNVEIVASGDGIASSTVLNLQVTGSTGCAAGRSMWPCARPTPIPKRPVRQ